MPYIKKEERQNFLSPVGLNPTRENIGFSAADTSENGGQLNYIISVAIANYVGKFGLNYDTIQDVFGMLEVVKAEFTSRIAIPYERLKAVENGGEIYDDLEKEIEDRWEALDAIWKNRQHTQSEK